MSIVPVILCGGVGSRLWPVSRDLHPKPFIRLADKQSLLQKALLRALDIPGASDVMTVTNRELLFKIEDEYKQLGLRNFHATFILEPFGRNTAAAIASACLHAEAIHGTEAMLLILAADHLISDTQSFNQAVERAAALAKEGKIVTFGIRPTSAETGYGYIEAEGERVMRFVEKPDAGAAEGYVASGRYFWNSGMFCFRVSTMIQEMQKHCPDILEKVRQCLSGSRRIEKKEFSEIELDAQSFAEVPDDSIDYAIMEKTDQIAIVQCDIGWSDIGSWTALGELTEADEEGNRVQGTAVLHDVGNTYIRSRERVVGAVGVDNLLIIDTSDALLVAHKDRAQDVKHVYAELKAKGHETHKLHQTAHRPWGSYTILEEGHRYKIKRIVVKPGASLSLQMHHHRSEHWVIVSGMAKVVNGDEEKLVNTNESTYIPAGHVHRVSNPGVLDLVMIEVQSGDYLGEDDIVRIQDNYGRI